MHSLTDRSRKSQTKTSERAYKVKLDIQQKQIRNSTSNSSSDKPGTSEPRPSKCVRNEIIVATQATRTITSRSSRPVRQRPYKLNDYIT